MRDPKQPLDLSSLENDYQIVGELGGSDGARTFVGTRKDAAAKRRDDHPSVLISIVRPPEGDESNALTHLAADTQLLMRSTHRRLIPVIEGRWIGEDAFAVVTQRTTDPSLAQMLATGETFSNPRAAAILREVNGLLEWARAQKIVHRSITTDRIYLEPKTDRVRVSFTVAPIPRIQPTSPADADARAIARLAMTMLTGQDDPRAYEGESLAELRPDLPEQLIDETAALLAGKTTGADVAAYLALVGMADPLAAGESEAERLRAEILAEQSMEREKLAGERADFESAMAEEREKLAKEEELRRAVADERATLERQMEDERQKLATERAALRRAADDERAALVAKRAELERTVDERRAQIERAAAEDRERIAALRAEIQRAGEREIEKKRQTALDDITDAESTLDEGDLATPLFVPPMLAPLDQLTFDDDTPLMRDEGVVVTPPPADETTVAASSTTEPVATDDGSGRRKWILSGALAGLVALAAASAFVFGSRPARVQPVANPVAASTVPSAPIAAAVPLPAPSAAMDSSAGSLAPSPDASRAVAPAVQRRPRVVVRDSIVRRDSAALEDAQPRSFFATPAMRDTLARRDSVPRADSTGVPPDSPDV